MITIHEIRQHLGLTQKDFAERYQIPKRTIENWETGKRQCPQYLIQLIAKDAGYIEQ